MANLRIRMTYSPTGENLTKDAWEKNIVGMWFGAWTLADLKKTANLSAHQAAQTLSALPAQRKLKWSITGRQVNTIRSFERIGPEDWVFSYFGQCLHMARVESPILAKEVKEFSRG